MIRRRGRGNVATARMRHRVGVVKPQQAGSIGAMQGQRITDPVGHLFGRIHPTRLELQEVATGQEMEPAIVAQQIFEVVIRRVHWLSYHVMTS